MRRTVPLLLVALVLALVLFSEAFCEEPTTAAPPLRFAVEDAAELAREARESGDATRGALVFFRPSLQCAGCHAADSQGKPPALGPELAAIGRPKSDRHVVESILAPSGEIREGFAPVVVATRDGKTITGLPAGERPDALLIRDPARDGAVVAIPRDEIEERKTGATSLMPAGLVEQLSDRREFLDLVRYVLEVAEHGPARALALRPPESAFAVAPLPEYESHVDHAGMIAGLGPESYRRGEAIYVRVCANCHGTKERPGSLPTSPRFGSEALKNGADPFRMYQTLTHGFGRMVGQSWMVPEQKYDVIHYIRETYFKPDNPSMYVPTDRAYLAALPKGDTRGPRPTAIEPWLTMDYGPTLALTCEVGDDGSNFAYKGVAVRLDAGPGGVARGRAWAVFEHDTLRLAGAWTGSGFIDWNGINFNGRHEVHPRIAGRVAFASGAGPGWADPSTGTFDDPRLRGRDGRAYGPLPPSWGRYRGQYRHGDQVILSYDVGHAEVLETLGVDEGAGGAEPVFRRVFNIGPRDRPMILQVARGASARLQTFASGDGADGAIAFLGAGSGLLAGVYPPVPGIAWSSTAEGDLRLTVPPGGEPLRFTLRIVQASSEDDAKTLALAIKGGPAPDLAALTKGGPSRWPEVLQTSFRRGGDDGPFAVDVLTLPDANPWNCRMRPSGLDFLPGGGLAVCTWDGDVWRVDGLDDPTGRLTWRRFACGLFQPLGLKVVDGIVYVSCRDQIVALHDRDHDGEADFYENFNSDHQVTDHFHEFAMDLQTDAEGSFYYAKAARHGKKAVVPQHGTLLKVARDGSRTEILATGFRAPNGVCLNPDGSFFSTDQEGFWLPKNRINHVVRGGFYGNMWGYHDVTDPSDSAMEPPVCWITNAMDRSPADPVWVDSDKWGPLDGRLLNLSYGVGKVFIVPHETVAGAVQGGVCELPGATFPTGVMRGRFRPEDGQLYLCGLYSWAGDRQQPGGLYRLRYTGKPVHVPVEIHARKDRIELTYSGPLDRATAGDPARFAVSTWTLRRSAAYGSKHYDERTIKVAAAGLSADARTLTLQIPDLGPTQCMEIVYDLKGAGGEPVAGRLHNTIHHLSD